ncbi:MAG: ABC transporter ATP-binding protein, partial [Deltaproteobacteria bacterium]
GPNGAGKSTLLAILSTLLAPTSGVVKYGEADARTAGPLLRSRLGLLGHDLYLYPELTARENLEFFARLYSLAGVRPLVDRALAHAGLLDRADDAVSAFSRGMRQRLALERALLHGPRLLLLDEPTASLDPAAARDIRAQIRELASRDGVGVLWTTHNMYEVADVCDRVLFLSHGKILLEGDPRTLPGEHGKETLEELFITVAREPLTLERG